MCFHKLVTNETKETATGTNQNSSTYLGPVCQILNQITIGVTNSWILLINRLRAVSLFSSKIRGEELTRPQSSSYRRYSAGRDGYRERELLIILCSSTSRAAVCYMKTTGDKSVERMQNKYVCDFDCERDVQPHARATSGLGHHRSPLALHAHRLTSFALFPTDFLGKETLAD